jgi:putative oxidoreductase
MLGAIAFVHFAGGFFLPTGFEYALVLMTINVGFALSGAGAYSLDAVLQHSRSHRSTLGPVHAV